MYLDWIEAYSDENVMQYAADDGVDTLDEMFTWINDIADTTRALDEDFIVITQNALELVEIWGQEYLDIIDAQAQEQTWFDGGADNVPPGDCPLPATEDDIDTPAYYDSLSPECRDYYDEHPDGTLHASTEEYLHYLTIARDMGEVVLTVDYALEPNNVAWIHETSRGLGFVPFVGNRALDMYVEPFPWE